MTGIPEKNRWFSWIGGNSPKCAINFTFSAMPFPDLEEAGIETSMEQFMKEAKDARAEYISALSKFLNVSEECILPVASGSVSIIIASFLLSTRNKSVSIPMPEYFPIFSIPESLGLRVKKIDLHTVPEDTESMMFSSPNNPVGIYPEWLNAIESLKDIDKFADETFLPFREDYKTSYRKYSGLLCAGTTTKYFGLGDFKTGWFIADPDEIEELKLVEDAVAPGISRYNMWIGLQALRSVEYFRKRSNRVMTENLNAVDSFVNETNGLSWIKPDSAPYGFVNFKGTGSEELCTRILNETGVLVVPGKYMGNDSGFRLCFTSGLEETRAGLEKLAHFFNSHFID